MKATEAIRVPIGNVALCTIALATLGGCEDQTRREAIETRNEQYAARQAEAAPEAMYAVKPEPERTNMEMACTPEKADWPIDQEACDLAQARYHETQRNSGTGISQ